MKSSIIAAILLPAVALAFPSMERRYTNGTNPTNGTHPTPTESQKPPMYQPTGTVCIPGKYQCHYSTTSGWGWDVCDTSSHWVNGGSCATGEVCTYNSLNGSPYCVPEPSEKPKPETGRDCNPNTYLCSYSDASGWAINTCGGDGHWKHELDCKSTETCTYGAVHGYPYCTPKENSRVCHPGTYQCSYDSVKGSWGWEVCTVEGKWVNGGHCKNSESCKFNALNGSPYCV